MHHDANAMTSLDQSFPSSMTRDRARKSSSRGSFGAGKGLDERQRQLYVSPATQHVNRLIARRAGSSRPALPLGKNVVVVSEYSMYYY